MGGGRSLAGWGSGRRGQDGGEDEVWRQSEEGGNSDTQVCNVSSKANFYAAAQTLTEVFVSASAHNLSQPS